MQAAWTAKWILLAKVSLALLGVVFAATITVTSTTYQAEFGSATTIAGGLTATDKGFSASATGAGSNGANCTSAVVFGASPKTANTNIVAGHLVYDVQVNTTASSIGSTKYNVTLVIGSTSYGPLCIMTQGVQPANQTIDCKFDVGTALPASPYAFKVTVQ